VLVFFLTWFSLFLSIFFGAIIVDVGFWFACGAFLAISPELGVVW
jgi:hypothetical protein